MALYDYQGVVEEVCEKETFASGFYKQVLVLTDPPEAMSQYPTHLPFTFKKDKCNLLATVKKGQCVKVRFALDGRKWTNPSGQVKYFTDLTGLGLEVVNGDGTTTEPTPAEPPAAAEADAASAGFPDDVPF